jgi:hypothetical protein
MSKFRDKFGKYACVGDSISVKVGKFTVTARIVFDEDSGPPWEHGDGYGVVSEWTTSD